MKLRMYDGNTIEIEKGMDYADLMDIIKTQLFEVPKYQIYYGFSGQTDYGTEDRWLGVKKVGGEKNEHVKLFLDSLTTLILTHSSYDNRDKLSTYKKLSYKKNLTRVEKQLFEELKGYVYYNKYGCLLFVNKAEEQRCESHNPKKYNNIKRIKAKVKLAGSKADRENFQMEEIKTKLAKADLETFKSLTKEFKASKERFEDALYELKTLVEDYDFLTEVCVNTVGGR